MAPIINLKTPPPTIEYTTDKKRSSMPHHNPTALITSNKTNVPAKLPSIHHLEGERVCESEGVIIGEDLSRVQGKQSKTPELSLSVLGKHFYTISTTKTNNLHPGVEEIVNLTIPFTMVTL